MTAVNRRFHPQKIPERSRENPHPDAGVAPRQPAFAAVARARELPLAAGMPARILVIYGTTEGQTAKIAAYMASRLRSTWQVDLVRAEDADDVRPDSYAAVIVAASVHAGGYQRPVRDWVRTHAAALGGRWTAFVSVCLAVLEHSEKTDRVISDIMERFFAETSWRPTERKVVAGGLPYSKYSWWKRWMMRRIVAKAGGDTDTSRDYEYTDWNDLAEFVRSVVPRLESHRAS